MGKNDWHSFDELGDAISKIIDSGDFSKLNDSVANSANQILDAIDQAVHGSYTSQAKSGSKYRQSDRDYSYRSAGYYNRNFTEKKADPQENFYWEQRKEEWASTKRVKEAAFEHTYNGTYNTADSKRASDRVMERFKKLVPWKNYPERFDDVSGSEVLSIFEIVGGGFVSAAGSALMITQMILGGGLLGPVAIMAAGAGVIYHGAKRLSLAQRYKKYAKVIGDREYIKIDDLAVEARVRAKLLRKDLLKILDKGWFIMGNLDAQESTLMLTNKAYTQYRQAYQNSIARQAEAEKAAQLKKEQEKAEALRQQKLAANEEIRKVIAEGRSYVEEIKRCNRNIPGVEISEKISKMELVCERIFNRVEEHPDLIDDLRKFMKYYLPTTVKLLQAYEKLDQEAVQGDNIRKSKKEIETTIDTINTAFENLLDGFFEDDVVDIKSDISVMQTMMAQEGLLHEELTGENSGRTDSPVNGTPASTSVKTGYSQASQAAVQTAPVSQNASAQAVQTAPEEMDAIQKLMQSGGK